MSEKDDNIPESIRPYLNEIAERLWDGRAAVMVGAGFSKNASPGFPDWNQLGDLFYEKAHGVTPEPSRQKYLNVLRLADELQAAIGRPALENLLRNYIPDREIDPSKLHVDLLKLPWVDVFTTNYDTLLERASASVVSQRYEAVVNKEDIPYALRPRIVKLHGSFPSERPFIITEEDYRRYPQDYAPFVNTVQQSLLENTFCLFGFSGDDPNFLQWIGWIRDNLKSDRTQKIYLVGLFDLSSARLQLLAKRGIIVVDLSGISGIRSKDHGMALKWFFDFLYRAKPNWRDWPNGYSTSRYPHESDRVAEIQKLTREWKLARENYSGWQILPYDNRKRLWSYTDAWVRKLPDASAFVNDSVGLDIQYAYELIWRSERCLLPMFSNVASFTEKLLEKYWPFEVGQPHRNCQHRFPEAHLHWEDIQEAWLSIALALLRFYREEGYLGKWRELEALLLSVDEYLRNEQRDSLAYEGVLFNLFALDLPEAKQRLENWRPHKAQPNWNIKRAGLLADIGMLNEAATVTRDVLESVRTKQQQKKGNQKLALLSAESNAMLLSMQIQGAITVVDMQRKDGSLSISEFNDRRNDLRGVNCDPWNELKLFRLTLDRPLTERKDVTESYGFDIGSISRTRHLYSVDEEALSAYAFFRFCEELGMPFRIGSYSIAKKEAKAGILRIAKYSPFWAIANLQRLGDSEAVDSLFSRRSILRFSTNEADQLIDNYLQVLSKNKDEIRAGSAFMSDSYALRLAEVLPEVISRLCCKASITAKQNVIVFLTEVFASPEKANYRNIAHLINRLLASLSEVERYQFVPALLKIQYPGALNPLMEREFINPFRFMDAIEKPEGVPPIQLQPEWIGNLLLQALAENPDERRWAITSLIALHRLKLLDKDQDKQLATVLWQKTDDSGLPDITDFYKSIFLALPHPDDIDPVQRFKEYVRVTPFPKHNPADGVSLMGDNTVIINEILWAKIGDESIWNSDEAVEILKRLIEWWDADKERLKERENEPKDFSSAPAQFRLRFSRMVEVLAQVIAPKLNGNASPEINALLSRLLKEMREYGLPCLRAEVAFLGIFPEEKADVYSRINESLISNEGDQILDGLRAIDGLLFGSIDNDITDDEADATAMLNQCLIWSPSRFISSALHIVLHILNKSAERFSGTLEVVTHRRLGRLLVETGYAADHPDLSLEEKLEIRQVTSSLAAELWRHYTDRQLSVPEVVEQWRAIGTSFDEFAEIRGPWIDIALLR